MKRRRGKPAGPPKPRDPFSADALARAGIVPGITRADAIAIFERLLLHEYQRSFGYPTQGAKERIAKLAAEAADKLEAEQAANGKSE